MSRKPSAKHKYTCPHCGAAYEVSAVRDGKPAYRTATCSYCGDVMAEWNGPARHYHRIRHPRTAT
jgi:transcription elongation factor Elf1